MCQVLLTISFCYHFVDVQSSLLEVLDQFWLFDGAYKLRPAHGIDTLFRQRNRRITDVVDHLQCGDKCVVFECSSEQTKFDYVVVVQIDRNISAVAAKLVLMRFCASAASSVFLVGVPQ